MGGDAARDRFVRELIAALEAQDALALGASPALGASLPAPAGSEGAAGEAEARAALFTGLFAPGQAARAAQAPSEATRADLAAEAHAQLQFDFPQLQDQQTRALAEVYRSFASSSVADGASVAEFALSRTLVDGIAYLNDRGNGAGGEQGRRSEASGMLAAAVLLELVRFLVEKRGTPKARVLLADLVVPMRDKPTPTAYSSDQDTLQPAAHQVSEDDFEEKFAAQEDPDDLSEVYEGGEPVDRSIHSLFASQIGHQAPAVNQGFDEKLRFLASETFSSSFSSLSVERWQDWALDDTLCSIVKMLLAPTNDSISSYDGKYFGVEGEWTRYFFILRDRLLQFPASSQRGIRNLKDLAKHFQTTHLPQFSLPHSASKVDREELTEAQQPHHVVYRVLAELVVSKEFQQRSSQRAQESLASAIYDLLPLIVDELQILSRKPSYNSHDNDRVVIFLQLLHFLMLTAANVRVMAERLHESGVLRTLLSLLPSSTPASDSTAEQTVWFRPLFRLVGECALWHEGIAEYISRVPRAASLLPSLPRLLPPEAAVLAFAFYQHQVNSSNNVWELFMSPSLFPPHCDSYLEAMEKLQGAVFVLDSLSTAIPAMRSPVRTELQQQVRKVYATIFPSGFEYPAPDTIKAVVQSKKPGAEADETNKTHDEDRGRAEGLQFDLLRNKLRQTMKTLLLGLAAGPGGQSTRSSSTSKVD